MELGMGNWFEGSEESESDTSRDDREKLVKHAKLPLCAAGFYCNQGSPSTYPYVTDNASNYGPCTPGHYCLEGAGSGTEDNGKLTEGN